MNPGDGDRIPVILDVDTGIDDAMAIWYALASPRLDVRGITSCFGNGGIEVTTRNTLLAVELSGRSVPVYQGAAHPLASGVVGTAEAFHGANGLGEAALPAVRGRAAPESAAEYLASALAPGGVVLVATARLTNLALALALHPELAEQIQRVVVMGGAAFCPGNVTAVAEANIWGDPEAADLVFQSGVPITMVGLDVTHQACLADRHMRASAPDPDRAYAEVLATATEFYMRAYNPGVPAGNRTCPLHDPLAVAVAEDPALVTTRPYEVRVSLQDPVTRGMTVVDARGSAPAPTHPVDVAVAVDAARFVQEFCRRLGYNEAL